MELQILNLIQQIRTPLGDFLMPLITKLGNAGIIWILLTVILLFIPKMRRVGIILCVALILDGLLCNLILKPLVARTRPFDLAQGIQLLIAKPTDFSFPSGHTAASFATVSALLFAGSKKLGFCALVLACLIAFSRLYLYVHYPTDVLGGLLIGLLCGYISYIMTKHFFKKD